MDKENHTILGGKVQLVQPKEGFRASLDSVLLGTSITSKKGSRILDLGTGVGTAALILAARTSGCHIEGIDFQEKLVDFAHEALALNKDVLTSSVNFHTLDLENVFETFKHESFDYIISNPPFLPKERGTEPENTIKKHAHNESMPLEKWLNYAMKLLKLKGRLSLVHRADRIHEILSILTPYPCGFWIYPIYPKEGTLANRVVVIAQKGVKNPTKFHEGLVIHKKDNTYTQMAENVLLHGKALFEGF